MIYSEKLRSPKWQKKRLEILTRDNFTCQLCGDTETELQIHHKEYISGKDPWEYDNALLITLCKDCHGFVSNNYYPDSIIKKHIGLNPVLIIVGDEGLAFKNHGNHLVIPHRILKDVVQAIINYWLKTENNQYLIDKNIYLNAQNIGV